MAQDIVIFSGLILGSMMLATVLYVYLKRNTFGLAGSVLTSFGVILIGLYFWDSANILIDADGKIEAKFDFIDRETEQQENIISQKLDKPTQVAPKPNQNKEINAEIEIDNTLPDGIATVCTASALFKKSLFVMSPDRNKATGVFAKREFPCPNSTKKIEIIKVNKKHAGYLYETIPTYSTFPVIISYPSKGE